MRRTFESALAATIGVMQQRIGFASSPDRHHQGIGDELGRHLSTHRPADRASGEQIDDSRHIEPTFRCPHIREVGDPFAVGSGRFEAAVEDVGSDGGDLPLTQIGRQSPPARTGFESLQPHQSLDPMQSARHTLRQHVVPHPPGAIGSIARKETRANLRTHLFVAAAAEGGKSGHRDYAKLVELIDEGLVHRAQLGAKGAGVYDSLIAGSTLQTLDDGEAATIAHANECGGVALIDERKARTLCAASFPSLIIASTIELLMHETVAAALGPQSQIDAVVKALTFARMRVPTEHVVRVRAMIGADRAALCTSLPKVARENAG